MNLSELNLEERQPTPLDHNRTFAQFFTYIPGDSMQETLDNSGKDEVGFWRETDDLEMDDFFELPEIRKMFDLRHRREEGIVTNLLQDKFANHLYQHSYLSMPAQLYLRKHFRTFQVVGVGKILDPIAAEMLGLMDMLRISSVKTAGIFDEKEAAEIEGDLYRAVQDSSLRARRILVEGIFSGDDLEDARAREYHETKPMGFTMQKNNELITITLAEWREAYIEKHDREP